MLRNTPRYLPRPRCSANAGRIRPPAPPVVVILGATSTGKTKLSIEVAEEFHGEVINSDKVQIYSGLDITTGRVPAVERLRVPHHLLGLPMPSNQAAAMSPSSYRKLATATIAAVSARGALPIVAGGSSSLVHALLSDHFNEAIVNPFDRGAADYRPKLRFPCCLLWLDVERAVLGEYLDSRVDDMVRSGMVDEVRRYLLTSGQQGPHSLLGDAIGVREFSEYFAGRTTLQSAIKDVKCNAMLLADAQVQKLRHMQEEWGWPLMRLDATAAVMEKLKETGQGEVHVSWQRDVRGPAFRAVLQFIRQQNRR